jgi:hypothetical protein
VVKATLTPVVVPAELDATSSNR